MRILELAERLAQEAQAMGGMRFVAPPEMVAEPRAGIPSSADPRWRPAPDPLSGGLTQDPEFSLPTTAGPVTWRLFYDTSSAGTDSGWGSGHRASLPLRLDNTGIPLMVEHEDG